MSLRYRLCLLITTSISRLPFLICVILYWKTILTWTINLFLLNRMGVGAWIDMGLCNDKCQDDVDEVMNSQVP